MNCIRYMLAFIPVVFVLGISGIASYAKDLPLDIRHQPSGLNSAFTFTRPEFDGYIEHTRAIISRARTDLSSGERDKIIEGNAPFALKPPASCEAGKKKTYRRGVLLTHGLTDSPYFMRPLGHFFQQNCFRVMAVLLPGHGTRPGDLLEVKWQEWAKAEAFGVNALSSEVDDVYLLGFSTGGTLSIYQSLNDERVKGLFLFSPALKVSPKAIMANWHEAIDWLLPRSKWVDIMPDEDPYKYESFPANAADQIHLLSTLIRAEVRKRKFMPPVFVSASEDDATVDTSVTLEFFDLAIHPLSTMVLYSTKTDPATAGVSEKIKRINSAFPSHRILGSAHTAIVLPPDDPRYGEKGVYANCIHYLPDQADKYNVCKSDKYDYRGELTAENMKKGVIQRLMYNPNYQSLQSSLKKFIDSLPSE